MKKVLVLLFSFFASTIIASAATGEGICEGRTLEGKDNYCMIDPVYIGHGSFSEPLTRFTRGDTAGGGYYYGTISGQKQNMLCIDYNLNPPTGLYYKYARSFHPDTSDYDRAVASIYQLLVHATVYEYNNGSCPSIYDCMHTFMQSANIALRSITAKFKFDIGALRTNDFISVADQLSGIPTTGTALNTSAPQFYIIKRWFCSGVLAVKEQYNKSLISQTAINNCSEPSIEAKAWSPSTESFKVKFALSTDEESTLTTNGDNFTKVVPVKITGLQHFNWDVFTKTNPFVKITGFKCDDGVVCTLNTEKSNISLNENILGKVTGDSYTIYVNVTGSSKLIKTSSNKKITISYEKYHILDIENLAVLRGYGSDMGSSYRNNQRLIVLMPTTSHKSEVPITITLPSICNIETRDGGQIYKLGDQEVSADAYIDAGCCKDIDPFYLTSDSAKEKYSNQCMAEDDIHLEQDCNQTCDDTKTVDSYNHSYVHQLSLKKVMNIINTIEKPGLYDTTSIQNEYKKYENYTDKQYIYDDITDKDNNTVTKKNSSENNYCMLYTSESNDIFYPGTSVATSGRFFVFDENTQPKVTGKILANMHTDYSRWLDDYNDRIAKEKTAYDQWEWEKDRADAISNMVEVASGPECCNCCTGSGSTLVCNSNSTYHVYSGTATGSYYYNDGTSQRQATEGYTVSCGSGSAPVANVSGTKAAYDTAIKNREDMEKYKKECETKNDLVNKWNYYLSPDLEFNYKQEYYDNASGKTIETTETEKMVISKTAEKYWKNISTDPILIPGSIKGTKKEENLDNSYGGGSTKKEVKITVDTNKDYEIGYEQTLYYRPATKYYSLLPSGEYVAVNTETGTGIGYTYDKTLKMEVGYVYNVELTNYQNSYYTWFVINNIGHLGSYTNTQNKRLNSNTQTSLNTFLDNHADELGITDRANGIDGSSFASKCYYCDTEVLYERECVTCDPKDDNVMYPQFVYRTVETSNLNPNNRVLGTNWSDAKGIAASELIETLGSGDTTAYLYGKDNSLVANASLSNKMTDASLKLLNSNNNDKTIASTYDPKENLECEFVLSPQDMKEIKESNKKINYTDMISSSSSSIDGMYYRCTEDGKECISNFVTEFSKRSNTMDVINTARSSKWKYYINGKWQTGTISNLFADGRYPDYTNDSNDAKYRMSNWP